MREKWVYALCAVVLAATLAVCIVFTGPPVAKAMAVLALSAGITGQYTAQEDGYPAFRASVILMFAALFLMSAAVGYYMLWALFP